VKCACLCGEEFEPERSNQVFLNAAHREVARNRRRPRVRVPTDAATLLRSPTTRQEAISAVGTVGEGTQMAGKNRERFKAKMGRQQSGEFLTSFQVAKFLGLSKWAIDDSLEDRLLNTPQTAWFLGVSTYALEYWRSRGPGGPSYVRVGRLVRYRFADLKKYIRDRTVTPKHDAG
jgi:predicted DNA-binding transcriptional regulator AlpA